MILLFVLIFAVSNVAYKGLINAIPVDIVARAAAKNLHAFFQFSSSLVSFCSEYRDRCHLKLMNKCILYAFMYVLFLCLCFTCSKFNNKNQEGLGMTASSLKRFFLIGCVRGLCSSQCLWLFWFHPGETYCTTHVNFRFRSYWVCLSCSLVGQTV